MPSFRVTNIFTYQIYKYIFILLFIYHEKNNYICYGFTNQINNNTIYNSLTDLYHSTNGNDWFNKTNWLNTSVSYCFWFGILCDNDKNVISILLSQNNLD